MREELRDIEVIRLQPALAETRGDWPCPFCEERQPIAGSYAARVRNLTNPSDIQVRAEASTSATHSDYLPPAADQAGSSFSSGSGVDLSRRRLTRSSAERANFLASSTLALAASRWSLARSADC